jgi:hypothetical protein
MTFAVTGGILAAGTIGLEAYNASQSTGLSNQASGQSGAIFGEQQGYAQMLSKLMADPSSVSSLPGYQFQFGQGADAVQREMGASGYLKSGNEAAALTQYGQGFAQNYFNSYEQQLAQLSGLTAASSPSQATGVAVGAQANSANQISSLTGQLGFLSMFAGAGGFGGGSSGINSTGFGYTGQ